MEPRKGFDFALDEYLDYDWLFVYPPEDDEEVYSVRADVEKAAKFYEVPPAFLEVVDDAMRDMADSLIKAFKADLEDMHDLLSD